QPVRQHQKNDEDDVLHRRQACGGNFFVASKHRASGFRLQVEVVTPPRRESQCRKSDPFGKLTNCNPVGWWNGMLFRVTEGHSLRTSGVRPRSGWSVRFKIEG